MTPALAVWKTELAASDVEAGCLWEKECGPCLHFVRLVVPADVAAAVVSVVVCALAVPERVRSASCPLLQSFAAPRVRPSALPTPWGHAAEGPQRSGRAECSCDSAIKGHD